MRLAAIGNVGLKECRDAGDGVVPSVRALEGYADSIVKVASGDAHCLVLLATGQVVTWGESACGRLGLEGELPATVDRPMLMNLDAVVDVACGAAHSLALCADGSVLAWGANTYGQLGLGSVATQRLPTRVPAPTGVRQVSAGAQHSLFLTEAGHAYACGRGMRGQLGCGGAVKCHTAPHVVKALAGYGVVSVCAGGDVSVFTTSNGEMWACGDNTTGALGLGDTKMRTTPQPVELERQKIVVGEVLRAPPPRYGTVESYTTSRLHKALNPIPSEAAVMKVAVGWGHSVVLDASGRVYTCGSNAKGQCGLGPGGAPALVTPRELEVALPQRQDAASVAARAFPVGCAVRYKCRRGVVVGAARGRVGVCLDTYKEGVRETLGVLPSELVRVEEVVDGEGAAGDEGPSPSPAGDTAAAAAAAAVAPAERVFVDDVACGRSFSAAVSGGLAYVWGTLQLPSASSAAAGAEEEGGGAVVLPRMAALRDGRRVTPQASPALGGSRPRVLPAAVFAPGGEAVSVRHVFPAFDGLFAVVEELAGEEEGARSSGVEHGGGGGGGGGGAAASSDAGSGSSEGVREEHTPSPPPLPSGVE